MRRNRTLRACVPVAALVAVLALASCASSISGSGSIEARPSDSAGSSAPSSPPPSSDSGPSTAPDTGSSASLPGRGKPTVVIGTKDFAEQFLLGQLYAKALAAKGYRVELKTNIGATEIVDKALSAGQIDMYPEYTGVIYTLLARRPGHASNATQVLEVDSAYERAHGATIQQPTPFQDTDGVAVTRAYATKHGLHSVADLAKVGKFSYGAPAQYRTLYPGPVGLREVYRLDDLVFKAVPISTQYQALDRGQIDAAEVFTTDGQLASGKYVVLSDPRHLFDAQQVVPVVRTSKVAALGSDFGRTLDAVSTALTQEAVIAMNKAVQIDQQDPGTVATAFLKSHHLA